MWEPTAEIQAAAAAPSRAIGCGGDRQGKRSAAPVREGTDTERRNGAGRGAGLRRNGNGSRAAERRGGQRSRERRRQGSYRRPCRGEGPGRASPAAGREELPPLPPSRLQPGSPRAWPRSCPPSAGGGGGAAPSFPFRRRGGGRRGRCGRRSAYASLGARVPRRAGPASAALCGAGASSEVGCFFFFEPPVWEWHGTSP